MSEMIAAVTFNCANTIFQNILLYMRKENACKPEAFFFPVTVEYANNRRDFRGLSTSSSQSFSLCFPGPSASALLGSAVDIQILEPQEMASTSLPEDSGAKMRSENHQIEHTPKWELGLTLSITSNTWLSALHVVGTCNMITWNGRLIPSRA